MLAASMCSWAQNEAEKKTSLDTVTVTGLPDNQSYQSGVTSVGKEPVSAKDVPQSLTVINQQLIRDQGKDSMKSALENAVGITFEAGEGGRIGDNIRLRGFSAAGDIYSGGVRDIAQYNRDIFNVEQVEVLRGPSSMLFGRGSTGGVINQVNKQAHLGNVREVNVTLGSPSYQRYLGDLNFQLDDSSALRVNAMLTKSKGRSNASGDSTFSNRRGLALDYRFGLGTANEFGLSYYHLSYKDRPDWGLDWLQEKVQAPGAEKFWYGLTSDFQNDKTDVVTLSHTYRWLDGSSLKTTLRNGRYYRSLSATRAKLSPDTLDGLNDSTTVGRKSKARSGADRHTFLQTDYTTTTQWFGRKNRILLGAEYALEKSTRFTYPAFGGIKLPSTVFGNPTSAAIAVSLNEKRLTTFDAATLGIYVQDTIDLAPLWQLVGGLRLDHVKGEYDRSGNPKPADATPLSRSDTLLSQRLGLIFQPNEEVNYYASYGTSFNTSGDLYQFNPANAKTDPEKSRSFEVGAKWELYGGDLSLRTSLSRTDKYNERSTDLDTTTQSYLLSGRRHATALEFELAGRLTPKWEVFAGIGFLQAKIDRLSSDPNKQSKNGANPGLSPSVQASLFTTYRINDKLRLGGGVTAVSENRSATNNSQTAVSSRVPGYAKADAMLEYSINRNTDFSLNINNLLDRSYYSTLYGGYAIPADRRNVRVTLNIKF